MSLVLVFPHVHSQDFRIVCHRIILFIDFGQRNDRARMDEWHGKAMNTSQLDSFLDNPFYHGMMQVKGKLYPHKYPPLISESLFNQVQKVKHGANKFNAVILAKMTFS